LADHPTPEVLERLLRSKLPALERRKLLSHVQACPECGRAVEQAACALLERLRPDGEPAAEATVEYDAVLDQVFAITLERARGRMPWRLPAVRPVGDSFEVSTVGGGMPGTWAYCEMLIECSRELRHRDPQRMVWFAELAKRAAENLNQEGYGREMVLDRQALAWAELGNAYRTADRFVEADAALAVAQERCEGGTGDPLLRGHLLDLTASLRRAQRRFTESVTLLDEAHRIFRRLNDPHLAGRALIQKGLTLTYTPDTETAVALVLEGLTQIDLEREPKLALAAFHQSIAALIYSGQFWRARRELFANRSLYLKDGDSLSLLKMRWLEGQIAAGLGELDRAETTLRQVRDGLADARLNFQCAIAGLELGAVLLRQGRTREVLGLVSEIVAVCKALGIAQEALGALILLRSACEQEYVTLEILDDVLGLLKEIERDPAVGLEARS
jgi:tetratricopeptide (TPR) repeat protein